MRLRFTKMQGLGNDFVVVNGLTKPVKLSALHIREMSDRHFGIGFDQLLLVEPPTTPGTDFRYRIFNADGKEVEQCGNGARCFVRYVVEHGLSSKTSLRIETSSGVIAPRLLQDGLVEVDMGIPLFSPADIPFIADERAMTYLLDVDGVMFEISALSMGNPHAILFVEDVDTAPVMVIGPRIERHKRFPERVNVGFVQIMDRRKIRLRVFERGVGETLACGTGACAAVAAAVLRNFTDRDVLVQTRGGDLTISWPSDGSGMMMRGPAKIVYEGEIELGDTDS
ncbi:MAG TPA: diaminopimelate epimerase [Burkholderiales bacterium]|nr:diaminopimelate epimerase [Burkholderiales bacterium]